jgi:hypothetical protein
MGANRELKPFIMTCVTAQVEARLNPRSGLAGLRVNRG